MAESRWTQSMLLDYYGELLTDKQRECFDLHYNEDLSLSEIAEQLGISRQGVWDNIRRAESAMLEIEEKTGLIRRARQRKSERSPGAGHRTLPGTSCVRSKGLRNKQWHLRAYPKN